MRRVGLLIVMVTLMAVTAGPAAPAAPTAGERLAAALRPLDRPALVLWGRHDPYLPVALADRQRDAFRTPRYACSNAALATGTPEQAAT